MVFVLVSRSRRVVPDKLVTLTSWNSRDFLIFLVMVGWKGKDAVKDGVVAFSCLLNCLRVRFNLHRLLFLLCGFRCNCKM